MWQTRAHDICELQPRTGRVFVVVSPGAHKLENLTNKIEFSVNKVVSKEKSGQSSLTVGQREREGESRHGIYS